MSKTLADLAPDERRDCIGMWCELRFTGCHEKAIIYHTNHPHTEVEETMLLQPGHGVFIVAPDRVTPLPDLPRAWTPDGKPTSR